MVRYACMTVWKSHMVDLNIRISEQMMDPQICDAQNNAKTVVYTFTNNTLQSIFTYYKPKENETCATLDTHAHHVQHFIFSMNHTSSPIVPLSVFSLLQLTVLPISVVSSSSFLSHRYRLW